MYRVMKCYDGDAITYLPHKEEERSVIVQKRELYSFRGAVEAEHDGTQIHRRE